MKGWGVCVGESLHYGRGAGGLLPGCSGGSGGEMLPREKSEGKLKLLK